MNDFDNLEIDNEKIYEFFLKSITNNDSDVIVLSSFLKNIGYSKKQIQREIKKYKKQKEKLRKSFSL